MVKKMLAAMVLVIALSGCYHYGGYGYRGGYGPYYGYSAPYGAREYRYNNYYSRDGHHDGSFRHHSGRAYRGDWDDSGDHYHYKYKHW